MNHREQILELYQALIEGELQVKTTVSGWVDTNSMILNSDNDVLSIYRRKPEPIIRYIATWIDVNGNLRSSGISNINCAFSSKTISSIISYIIIVLIML